MDGMMFLVRGCGEICCWMCVFGKVWGRLFRWNGKDKKAVMDRVCRLSPRSKEG